MPPLNNRIESYTCDGSSTEIPKGVAVIRDATADWSCKLPTAAGVKTLGITDDRATRANFAMSVIRNGRAEAIVDSAIAAGDRVAIAGTSGRIKKASATLSTAMTGTNNDLDFTAVEGGLEGEEVTVEFVDPGGTTATLSIDVQGTGVKVNLGRAGSAINTTAAALKTAWDASGAVALATVALKSGNDGTGLVTALAETPLSGSGYDFGVAEEAATAQYDKIWITIDKAEG